MPGQKKKEEVPGIVGLVGLIFIVFMTWFVCKVIEPIPNCLVDFKYYSDELCTVDFTDDVTAKAAKEW